jgi:hypothetical protein
MRWRARSLLLLCCVLGCGLLAACQAGQNGADALAFIRAGKLYRMQPEGSGLYQITPGTVIGFAWSPDHHMLIARFAAGTGPPAAAYPNLVADTPAALGVVSIDGGNILPITPPAPIVTRSDAWWDAAGNRLFYREHLGNRIQWVISQSDQPNGIARKGLGTSLSTPQAPAGGAVPTSAPDASQVAWVTDSGALVLGRPGGAAHALVTGALPYLANGAPARPLWQPRQRAILFAGGTPTQPALLLSDLNGKTHQVVQAPFDGYSWSPDGTHILVHTPGQWTIYTPGGTSVMMWADAAPGGIPWWSPDGRYVLVIAPTALTLASVATKRATTLATLTANAAGAPLPLAAMITGSPWRGDSRQFALVATGGTWQDHAVLATRATPGTGLYIVSIGATNHAPKLVDWGAHQALSWTTPDPNTLWVTS